MSTWTISRRSAAALRRFGREEDGGILIETAFVMPVLIIMLLGSVEVGRYLIAHQKLERAASSVADLISQSEDTVTLAEINTLFGIVPHITAPYDVDASGRVIVTAVTRGGNEADEPVVVWQIDGMGDLNVTSQVGAVGDTPALPGGMVVGTGETLIIAEAWYDYEAYFFEEIDPTGPIYHRALYRPRLSSLSQPPQ